MRPRIARSRPASCGRARASSGPPAASAPAIGLWLGRCRPVQKKISDQRRRGGGDAPDRGRGRNRAGGGRLAGEVDAMVEGGEQDAAEQDAEAAAAALGGEGERQDEEGDQRDASPPARSGCRYSVPICGAVIPRLPCPAPGDQLGQGQLVLVSGRAAQAAVFEPQRLRRN